MEETILTAKDLKFRYDPEQPDYALNGVSAEVKRGEFVAVLGANGCGKSTLLSLTIPAEVPVCGSVPPSAASRRRAATALHPGSPTIHSLLTSDPRVSYIFHSFS